VEKENTDSGTGIAKKTLIHGEGRERILRQDRDLETGRPEFRLANRCFFIKDRGELREREAA